MQTANHTPAPYSNSQGEPQGAQAAYTTALTRKFNPEQKLAVTLPDVSALILAGAGSGKTSVLIGRIANLINKGLSSSRILAVTFTNKSAEEMRKRLTDKMSWEDVRAIWAGTFHSLCNRMLRENYLAAGLPKNFGILDTDGQESMIRTLVKERNLAIFGKSAEPEGEDGKAPADEPDKIVPKEVVRFINAKKELGIKPYQIDAPVHSAVFEFVEIFQAYERTCASQGLLDFNDLLYKTVEMLRNDKETREKYRQRFDAILVDEFQDTNDIQYEWLQLLKRPTAHMMAVGDDDQSIYAFRGAKPANMQRFVKEMTVDASAPQGRIIRLERNYRSLPFILDSANAVIGRNTNRLGKNLWTDEPDQGEKILLTSFETAGAEAKVIAQKIHALLKRKVAPREIAIQYRTNMQSRLLEQEINSLGIPATVYGGFRFYEREEIKHVIAYLDLIQSFNRDISFARVVNFPPRGLGARTVEDLRQDAKQNNVSMFDMIGVRINNGAATSGTAAARNKQAMLQQFAFMLMDLVDRAQEISLAALVTDLVKNTGLHAHYSGLPKEEAEERMSNIGELISAAKQFEVEHPEFTTAEQMLPEYLSFVQLMSSTSEADMDTKNTVSLMTVHSAKGLEFDYVFVAGLEEGIFPHQRSLGETDGKLVSNPFGSVTVGMAADYDEGGNLTDEAMEAISAAREKADIGNDTPELQEERRLMYVAMTRARKHLEISFAKVRQHNGKDEVQKESRFLREIPANRVMRVKDTQFARNPADRGNAPWQKTNNAPANQYPAPKAVAPASTPAWCATSALERRKPF